MVPLAFCVTVMAVETGLIVTVVDAAVEVTPLIVTVHV